MNELSWLLYAASVFGGLKTLFMLVGIIGFCVCVFSFFLNIISEGEVQRVPLKYYIPAFLVIVVGTLIPNTTTMYLIASSEIGSRVITSPSGEEMMGLLKHKIENYLKDEDRP